MQPTRLRGARTHNLRSLDLEIAVLAGVLGPLHSTQEAWNKSSDILLDYVRWLSTQPDRANAPFDEFDVVDVMSGDSAACSVEHAG